MNPTPPYRLTLTADVIDIVNSLLRRPAPGEVRGRVRTALLTIERELKDRPGDLGDPVRRLRHARLTEYHRLYDELSVRYVVHDQEADVFLVDLVPVMGHAHRGG